jgi:hypothetical protein
MPRCSQSETIATPTHSASAHYCIRPQHRSKGTRADRLNVLIIDALVNESVVIVHVGLAVGAPSCGLVARATPAPRGS